MTRRFGARLSLRRARCDKLVLPESPIPDVLAFSRGCTEERDLVGSRAGANEGSICFPPTLIPNKNTKEVFVYKICASGRFPSNATSQKLVWELNLGSASAFSEPKPKSTEPRRAASWWWPTSTAPPSAPLACAANGPRVPSCRTGLGRGFSRPCRKACGGAELFFWVILLLVIVCVSFV